MTSYLFLPGFHYCHQLLVIRLHLGLNGFYFSPYFGLVVLYHGFEPSYGAIRRSQSAVIIHLLGSTLMVHNLKLNPIDQSI
jgi:hypothetical protein